MANTAHDVLAVARAELGYTAKGDPETGTKFGRWYAQGHGSYFSQTGVAWCAMFVSWCFAQAGATCPGLPNAACEYVRQQAKKAGALRANVRDAQPGDVILFDWGDGGWADHVGIVESNHGTYVSTIEGNVAGGVYRRNRGWSTVVAVVVPSYDAPKPTPKPSGAPSGAVNPKASPLAIDGVFGPVTKRKVQEFLRYHGHYKGRIDGDWGPMSRKALQSYLRAKGHYTRAVDGSVGPYTVRALQSYLLALRCYWNASGWCVVDGSWGAETTKAIQRAIDANVF